MGHESIRSTCLPLVLDARAPAQARLFTTSRCEHLPPGILAEVLLLTTELVNNALWHGGGDASLDLRVTERSVTVGVTDGGGGQVRLLPKFLWPESGHGLRLVDDLADRWGVEPADGTPGKRVWFDRTWEIPDA